MLRIFSVGISVSPHVYFILVLGLFHANKRTKCLRNQSRTMGEGWSTENLLKTSVVLLLPFQGGSSVLVLRWFKMWSVVMFR